MPVGPKIVENIVVTSLGHAFGPVPTDGPGPKRYFVQDFLVDQSQSTGGGAVLQSPLQFDLSASYGYRYSVTAPSGMRFQVKAPAGAAALSFSAFLGRAWEDLMGGTLDQSPAVSQFAGVTGPAPVLAYNSFFISDGNNQALTFEVEGTCQDFWFSAFVTEQSFPPRTQDPGAKWYRPLSYAVPFGVTSAPPGSETFLVFQSTLSEPVDPGPFVTLVPISPELGG